MSNQKESLDVNAKTVEEAIAQGLAQLGLSQDQVTIEVISEGKRGIFGLGSEDAVVRLTPKAQPEVVAEPRPTPEVMPGHVTTPAPEPETEETTDTEPSLLDDAAAVAPPGQVADEVLGEKAEKKQPPQQRQQIRPDVSDVDVEKIAVEYLEGLLERMGVTDVRVTTRMASDLVDPGEEAPLVLDVQGKDLGILIGRRSETLQALQYMVRLMVSKKMGSWQRIVVDVESYRARRRQSLRQMAQRMAERAVANQERVVMESMSAYERRIIHVALRDHPAVFTKSIGRENNRKVTIIPK